MHIVLLFVAALLSAPAGAPGACANADDQRVLAAQEERIDDEMEDCAFACLTSDAACARACVERAFALSRGCATCFGEVIDCAASNCKLACMFSDSMCRACRAEHCNAGFERCAGVEAR